jgi:hypothetical protein
MITLVQANLTLVQSGPSCLRPIFDGSIICNNVSCLVHAWFIGFIAGHSWFIDYLMWPGWIVGDRGEFLIEPALISIFHPDSCLVQIILFFSR